MARSADLTITSVSFARNAAIYREGDPVGDLFKVVSGVVRTCKHLLDGRRQIGAFYLPGDTFGFEPAAEHIFRSEAVTRTEVLLIKRTNVVSSQLLDVMHRELQLAQSHRLLLIKTAPERLASFLLEMAERISCYEGVELPMSRQDVADYLGLSIETVCRTFQDFERQAIIEMPNSRQIMLRYAVKLNELVRGGRGIRTPKMSGMSTRSGRTVAGRALG